MKKIVGGILLFVAIYTGLWFYGVNQMRDRVTRELSATADEAHCTVAFDKVSTAGFPFSLVVNYTQMRCLAAEDQQELWSLDGTCSVGSDIWGERAWLGITGTLKHANSDSVVTLEGTHRLQARDIERTLAGLRSVDPGKVFNEIEEITLDSSALRLTVTQGESQLQVPVKTLFVKAKQLGKSSERLNWKLVVDMEQDEPVSLPQALLTEHSQDRLLLSVLTRESRALAPAPGKSNYEFEIDLPPVTTLEGYLQQPLSLLVDLQPMSIRIHGTSLSALGTGDMDVHYSVDKDEDGKLLFSFANHFSAEWTDLLTQIWRRTVVGVVDGLPEIADVEGTLDPIAVAWSQEHKDALAGLIPNMESFGKVSLNTVIDGAVPLAALEGKEAVSVHLRDFGIKSARGGFALGCDLQLVPHPGQIGPSLNTLNGKAKVHLYNAEQVITESCGAYNAMATLLRDLAERRGEAAGPLIEDAFVKQLITFLRSVATDPQATDLAIHLTCKEQGVVEVNGRSLQEVAALWTIAGMPPQKN